MTAWWRIFYQNLGREATEDELELASVYEREGCSPNAAVDEIQEGR